MFKNRAIYYQNNGSVLATHHTLRPIFARHNRPADSIIRATMNGFRTMFTQVYRDAVQCARCCCCGAEYQRRYEQIHAPSRATNEDVPIQFMKDFAVGSCFAGSQNPTRDFFRIWSDVNP